MSKFTDRLKSAPKAFSVQAITALATSPYWWPVVDIAAQGAFGPKAQTYVTVLLGVAGILGWAVPQRSIPKPEPDLNK